MKFRACVGVCALLLTLGLYAREVRVTLWISGGMEGLIAGEQANPGFMAVAQQVARTQGSTLWLDVGGTRDWGCLQAIPGLPLPDAVVPTEAAWRLRGPDGLHSTAEPLTLANVIPLPQFPEAEVPFPALLDWEQPDGVRVRVIGALSESAGLRIPLPLREPWALLAAREAVRSLVLENPFSPDTLGVLVIPEGEDVREWSNTMPDFPVLVTQPSAPARVISLDDGKRLRVTPGRGGRSVIRVEVFWDTVRREFRDPVGEVVWVQPADIEALELPDCATERLRILSGGETVSAVNRLLTEADAVWARGLSREVTLRGRPDARRAELVPEADAWLSVRLDRSTWRRWREADPAAWRTGAGAGGGATRVLVPARIAAGDGDWYSVIRQDLLSGELAAEWRTFAPEFWWKGQGEP